MDELGNNNRPIQLRQKDVFVKTYVKEETIGLPYMAYQSYIEYSDLKGKYLIGGRAYYSLQPSSGASNSNVLYNLYGLVDHGGVKQTFGQILDQKLFVVSNPMQIEAASFFYFDAFFRAAIVGSQKVYMRLELFYSNVPKSTVLF